MKKHLMIFGAAVLAFTACKKETTTPEPAAVNPGSWRIQLDGLKPAVQNFTLDAATGGTITGAKGGIFTIPANAFVTPAGQPVTGTVSVELMEVYSPLDMLLAEKYPRSYSGPLYSGGEFFLNVKQGSMQLNLAPGQNYTASLPSPALETGMQVFDGQGTADTVRWFPADSSYTNLSYSWGNNGGGFYDLLCDSIRNVNCDQFPGNGLQNWTHNIINLNSPVTLTSVQAFVFYNGHRSMFNIYPGISQMQFTNYECWENQQVHYIAIGSDASGNVYSGMIDVTVALNQTYSISLSATTATAFAAQVNALQ